ILIFALTAVSFGAVREGTHEKFDLDVTFSTSQLSANWDAVENAKSYMYAVGTRQNKADVVNWTKNGLERKFECSSLSLKIGQKYFVRVYAILEDGTSSKIITSNGIKVKRMYKGGVIENEQARTFKTSSFFSKAEKMMVQAESLPSKVVNHTYLPPVGDQGSQASCLGWAGGYYYKTYQEAKEHGWVKPDPNVDPEHVMSPAFVYNLLNGGEDKGGGWFGGVLAYQGCATWEEMPYDENDYTSWGSSEVWKNAIRYKTGKGNETVQLTDKIDIDSKILKIKQHLADGNLVPLSITLYPPFLSYPEDWPECINNGVIYGDREPTVSGHAVCIIGYDDNMSYYDDKEGRKKYGAFLCVNSWGQDWGVYNDEVGTKGFFYIAYDYFKDCLDTGSSYAVIYNELENYAPTRLAYLDVEHENKYEISIQMLKEMHSEDSTYKHVRNEYKTIESIRGPRWNCTDYDHPINQMLVFDISDSYEEYGTGTITKAELVNLDKPVMLKIGDWHSEKIGSITSFAIEDNSIVIDSTDTPKAINDYALTYLSLLFDTSPPESEVVVRDGLAGDIDYVSSLTTLSANWDEAIDNLSGITKYWYAVGLSSFTTEVVNWTDNGLSTSVTVDSLNLTENEKYYFLVKVEDGKGLLSGVYASNGQLVDTIAPLATLVKDSNIFKTGEHIVYLELVDNCPIPKVPELFLQITPPKKLNLRK
ncbi:C1 family peptidase, partial [bacterium]